MPNSVQIVPMYIEIVPNRSSPPAILLREGWREGKNVKKRTIANLSKWPKHKIDALRRVLNDEPLMCVDDVFSIKRALPHGHVEAILGTIRLLGLEHVIAAKRCRERDLVLAMIVERLIHASSKLGTIRLWRDTTLAEELEVQDADEQDLYAAMDWLLRRKPLIEKKLAKKHLSDGMQALYDVTSSYYEGHTCPLACFGHNRDGKKGKTIIIYGVLADPEGRPIATEVYPGNTGDPTTVPDQVGKLRTRFGLTNIVLVGDRGMLTQTQINTLKQHPGLGWISALRSQAIRKLVDSGSLQLSLFDQQNLAEITSPLFEGERLIACYNPLLAEERKRKRTELLQATERELQRIANEVSRRTKKLLSAGEIGKKVGKVLNRYKVAKHFKVTIGDSSLSFTRRENKIRQEAELDGIYVVRTSEPKEQLSPEDTVRSYKNLSRVEQAFRCLKSVDVLVRPIWHRLEDRVRAHIFLCMLAYYVEWHMRKALAPLLFDDEELNDNRKTRDPVLPAKPSASAKRKKRTRRTSEGLEIHSLDTLLEHLGTRTRNDCILRQDAEGPIVQKLTDPTPLQEKALTLLGLFPDTGK